MAPNFFGGGPSKFWYLDYQIQETSDHLAKFCGDRPMELEDPALKKDFKKSAVNIRLPVTTVPGGLTSWLLHEIPAVHSMLADSHTG